RRPEPLVPHGHSRWRLATKYVPRAYHFELQSWLSSSRSLSCRQQTVGDSRSDFRFAESRLSETETTSGGTKDSEEPQDSDDRASETLLYSLLSIMGYSQLADCIDLVRKIL
ncbi:hypothetical protein Tco_0346455, partial [Tanacetum coccineum]